MSLHEQRDYVNEEFGKQCSGKSFNNRQKSRLLKKLWREAKRKYSE